MSDTNKESFIVLQPPLGERRRLRRRHHKDHNRRTSDACAREFAYAGGITKRFSNWNISRLGRLVPRAASALTEFRIYADAADPQYAASALRAAAGGAGSRTKL
ncbi:hypothetical protein EVAR_22762_1 [Eumeta japonica]|uniref:Uncharacterized protein n=1 Tax=Eumeta variegata TaxID=151549 RepID=A0A4C1USV1_EUMVA|nr:hypothetical protein EVAR_22762_1 [Eumeta japonica]